MGVNLLQIMDVDTTVREKRWKAQAPIEQDAATPVMTQTLMQRGVAALRSKQIDQGFQPDALKQRNMMSRG